MIWDPVYIIQIRTRLDPRTKKSQLVFGQSPVWPDRQTSLIMAKLLAFKTDHYENQY